MGKYKFKLACPSIPHLSNPCMFKLQMINFHHYRVNLCLFQNWRAQSQMIASGDATKLQRLCLIWFWKG